MTNKVLENIAKLIDVKSIVTFVIVAGITYGFVTGQVNSETFCTFGGTIIAYYFTRQSNTGSASDANTTNETK